MPSPQEEYWAGRAGTEFASRWRDLITTPEFHEVLNQVEPVNSIIEIGAGSGRFLFTAAEKFPDAALAATEINGTVALELRSQVPTVYEGSIVEQPIPDRYDLVMVMGVLACVPGDLIASAYEHVHAACGRYLLLREFAEHGSPTQRPYTNSSLWIRDYWQEIPRHFPGFSLVDARHEGSSIYYFLFESDQQGL